MYHICKWKKDREGEIDKHTHTWRTLVLKCSMVNLINDWSLSDIVQVGQKLEKILPGLKVGWMFCNLFILYRLSILNTHKFFVNICRKEFGQNRFLKKSNMYTCSFYTLKTDFKSCILHWRNKRNKKKLSKSVE